jgi:hypothetical protein
MSRNVKQRQPVVIPDDTFEWLQQVLAPTTLTCNSTLGEFVAENAKKELLDVITFRKNNP